MTHLCCPKTTDVVSSSLTAAQQSTVRPGRAVALTLPVATFQIMTVPSPEQEATCLSCVMAMSLTQSACRSNERISCPVCMPQTFTLPSAPAVTQMSRQGATATRVMAAPPCPSSTHIATSLLR